MSAANSAWIACSIKLRAPSRMISVNASGANPDGSGSWVMVFSCMWHIPFSAENRRRLNTATICRPSGHHQLSRVTPSEAWTAIRTAEHFDAIVVHEFTHALVDQAALVERACSADEEYIAYAMQVESLSESTRAALITNFGTLPPVSVEEIGPLVLCFSPSAFAVRFWLHFSEQENGCEFVGKIIRGEVAFWEYPE